MKRVFHFIVSTIIRGLFLIIPISIVVIMLGKVYSVLQKLMTAMKLDFAGKTFLHTSMENIIGIFFILLICFLAGALVWLKPVHRLRNWIENNVLQMLPGYKFMKSSAEQLLGVTGHDFREVVIIREDDSMLLGFRVEDVTPTIAMVFVPTAPEPRSARILMVNKNRLISTSLKTCEAFVLIKGMGAGSREALGAYLTESPPGAGNK